MSKKNLKFKKEDIELAEHIRIYNIVQKRKTTPLSEYVSMEKMAKKFNIDLEAIEEDK